MQEVDGGKGTVSDVAELCGIALKQSRTNEAVRWPMNFSSGAMAEIEGLLEVNREICMPQRTEKTSPDAPPNCAALP